MRNYQPNCKTCKHFSFFGDNALTCRAYPNRIPEEIYNGGVMHYVSYKNDGGITYERDSDINEDEFGSDSS